MKDRKRLVIGIVCAIINISVAYGQKNGVYLGEVKKMVNEMKNTKDMAYEYSLSAEYPNGQKDALKGEVYIGNEEKVMYNSNDAFTMVYTSDWYYKADHREKTVAIVNINKHLKKGYKEGIEKDMFDNNALTIYLDSVIMKYASVKSLKVDNDTVHLTLGFPARMLIKTIALVYDEKNKVMVSYLTNTFQPWNSNEFGKDKGTTKAIACWNFRKVDDDKKYKAGNFFAVKKDKAVLKKYKKYKLISKL